MATVAPKRQLTEDDDKGDERRVKRNRVEDDPCSLESLRKVYHETTPWRNNVVAKHAAAAPFYFFLTRVKDIPQTYDEDLSITFPELLDVSLGEIEHTLHCNFMVGLPWLLAQYATVGIINPPMTILYGVDDPDLTNIPKNLRTTAHKVKMNSPFGHHHTKMSVFFYKDSSVRFVVSTANLYESDWENRTQGVWISPRCSKLSDDLPNNAGESETLFKYSVIDYLNSYHIPNLRPWLQRLQRIDASKINVFLIPSVPGAHNTGRYGYQKLSSILRKHVTGDFEGWQIVAQCSSIGSLGSSPAAWLQGAFGQSLQEKASLKQSTVNVIYPSLSNVRESVDGMLGGGCLPYSSSTHVKQQWLNAHLKQWKSDCRNRSRAVPHIKSYTKLSPDGSQIAWFLLTSANLSKAAWGSMTKDGIRILSNEVGVLFLPKYLIGKNVFNVRRHGKFEDADCFPLPYDSKLTSYTPEDEIFLYDKCFRS